MLIRRKKQDVPAARELRAERAIKAAGYSLALETVSSVKYETRRKGLVIL